MPLIDDFSRTKIICTIGPSSSSPARIRELILAGMDVARLSFSHGDHDTHREACSIADELDAPAIVAATSSGSTARLVARYRPSCPIPALTPNPSTERQLTISWGIIPVLVSSFKNVDEIFALAKSRATENNIAAEGDRLVVTAGVPVGEPGTTNLLKVLEVE